MSGLVLAVVILAALAVAVVLFRVTHRPTGPMEECAGADLDGSTYRPCGRTMTARQAHVLVAVWDEVDGTGSGVSQAFCSAHCPGGCRRGCRTAIRS